MQYWLQYKLEYFVLIISLLGIYPEEILPQVITDICITKLHTEKPKYNPNIHDCGLVK